MDFFKEDNNIFNDDLSSPRSNKSSNSSDLKKKKKKKKKEKKKKSKRYACIKLCDMQFRSVIDGVIDSSSRHYMNNITFDKCMQKADNIKISLIGENESEFKRGTCGHCCNWFFTFISEEIVGCSKKVKDNSIILPRSVETTISWEDMLIKYLEKFVQCKYCFSWEGNLVVIGKGKKAYVAHNCSANSLGCPQYKISTKKMINVMAQK